MLLASARWRSFLLLAFFGLPFFSFGAGSVSPSFTPSLKGVKAKLNLHSSTVSSSITDSILSDTLIFIGKISVEGNKQTKRAIIDRELIFKTGDTISRSQLAAVFKRSKENVLNTSLFHFVDIDVVSDTMKNPIDVKITVYERWYIWPLPIFELADRNINVWWDTKDFRRTNYGAYIVQENFRGKNEVFKILIRGGYTQKYGLSYLIPYLSKKKKGGISFTVAYSRNHEIAYRTIDNRLKFFKLENRYMRKEIYSGITYTYRKGLYNMHSITGEYKKENLGDSILKLNPDYFLNNETEQEYVCLGYRFRRNMTDISAYPLHGYLIDGEVVHKWLYFDPNNSLTYADLTLKKYFQLFTRTYFAALIKGKVSGTAIQPYYNESGLGYNSDFVRGYEKFVVDGQHYLLWRSNLKYNLLPTKVVKIKQIPAEKFNTFPVALYLNLLCDMGYVWDHQDYKVNPLTNSMLYSTGIGMDYVTYYSSVFRLEYSFSFRRKPGLFLGLTIPV